MKRRYKVHKIYELVEEITVDAESEEEAEFLANQESDENIYSKKHIFSEVMSSKAIPGRKKKV